MIEAIPLDNTLGEGPAWHPTEQALYWVDIPERRLFRWDGEVQSWDLPVRASAPVFTRTGIALATERGVADFDPRAGLTPRLTLEPDRPGNRSNEARVGADGRLWVGTMDDSEEVASGALYSVSVDGTVTRHLDGVGISNTLCWSPDGRTLYYADSLQQTMYAHDFDATMGAVSNRRAWMDTCGTTWTPDGSAMDAEGCLWNCQWDGRRIVRYAPDGSVDRVVEVPVARPTCCCFGGPDLDVLYVTTARVGLSEAELAGQPWAGSVLALNLGVVGRPEPLWVA